MYSNAQVTRDQSLCSYERLMWHIESQCTLILLAAHRTTLQLSSGVRLFLPHAYFRLCLFRAKPANSQGVPNLSAVL